MSLLIELRKAVTSPRRTLDLAIVTVSKLNACHYCVAHHEPFLVVEGVSPAGVDRILDYRDRPEFDDRDKLVANMRSPPGKDRAGSTTPHLSACATISPKLNQNRRVDLAHHALLLFRQVQRGAGNREGAGADRSTHAARRRSVKPDFKSLHLHSSDRPVSLRLEIDAVKEVCRAVPKVVCHLSQVGRRFIVCAVSRDAGPPA